VFGYDSGSDLGKTLGNTLGYDSGSDMGKALCNTLGTTRVATRVRFWVAMQVRNQAQS
jgi:hypothetical protein